MAAVVERTAAAQRPIGNGERIGSAIAGTALIVHALIRPTLGRIALAIGGAILLQRSLTGHRAAYERLGIDELPAHPLDRVETASEDSFPASDPPAWTPVAGAGR